MDNILTLKKVGLFYGSSTCYTEIAAEKITQKITEILKDKKLSDVFSIELFNTKETPLKEAESFDILILGISTWDFGEIQEDWLREWHNLELIDFNNKIVAIFGLGDQQGYSDWFLDAMGLLHKKLAAYSIHWSGFWPTTGYTFTSTLPLIDDENLFVGLALDEDSQYDLSDQRIERWCEQLIVEWLDILELN